MRIFVTGASGWIGSAVTAELLRAGHSVLGMARSDASAERVAALGADVHRGDLDDLDSLRKGAAAADGVVHLGYNHDFSRMAEAARTDAAAIEVFGEALAGSGGPLVMASGLVGVGRGGPATEQDVPAPESHPRMINSIRTVELAAQGVRTAVVRFAPTVHGDGDHGFVAELVRVARAQGVSGYVGDGANRWPAVHVLDAAALIGRIVEQGTPGSVWHATAEEGVPAKEIAEAIGRGTGLPVESVPAERAAEHFGWIGRFFAADLPATSEQTRKLLDWHPAHPALIADLDAGHYFKS